ncbi:MAG: hypothetical protein GEU98_18470 [Pseudonocardiaceae bacterium]|nr:hypothetical protein [Pseudonocardiaceae bacterium]
MTTTTQERIDTTTPSKRWTRRRKLPRRWRQFVVLLHVILSVGWLGVAASALVLSIVAFFETRVPVLRAVYEFHGMLIAVLTRPIGIGAVVTGIILSLGTKWGLVRHYWVLTKFVLSIGAILLSAMVQTELIEVGLAYANTPGSAELASAQSGILLVAIFHVVALGLSTGLSVYKPRLRRGS